MPVGTRRCPRVPPRAECLSLGPPRLPFSREHPPRCSQAPSLTSPCPGPPPWPRSTRVTRLCVCHSFWVPAPLACPLLMMDPGRHISAARRCVPNPGVPQEVLLRTASPGAAVCLPHLLGGAVRGGLTRGAEQSLTGLHPIRRGLASWAGSSRLPPCLLSSHLGLARPPGISEPDLLWKRGSLAGLRMRVTHSPARTGQSPRPMGPPS